MLDGFLVKMISSDRTGFAQDYCGAIEVNLLHDIRNRSSFIFLYAFNFLISMGWIYVVSPVFSDAELV